VTLPPKERIPTHQETLKTPSGTNVTIVDLVWDESQGRSVRQKRDEILETPDPWFGGDSEQTWKKFSDNKRNQRRVSER
jgi:hypothetical protein